MQSVYTDWNEVYTSVNNADAQAFAAALERALINLTDQTTNRPAAELRLNSRLQGARPSGANVRHPDHGLDPYGGPTDKGMAKVMEIVTFAQHGRFRVALAQSLPVDNAMTANPPKDRRLGYGRLSPAVHSAASQLVFRRGPLSVGDCSITRPRCCTTSATAPPIDILWGFPSSSPEPLAQAAASLLN